MTKSKIDGKLTKERSKNIKIFIVFLIILTVVGVGVYIRNNFVRRSSVESYSPEKYNKTEFFVKFKDQAH